MPSPPSAREDPLAVGRRVVVRYRLPEGSQPPLTDVVGVVSAVGEGSVTVDTRRGPVVVRRADIVLVKAVPPAPARRGRPHTAISVADLERVMADGWRAVEEEWLGDWVMRAADGFTRRANSVLPLGEPHLVLPEAISHVEAWYATRALPPLFHVDLPSSGAVEEDALGAALLERGYEPEGRTLVMTGATADVEPAGREGPAVELSATLTPDWLEAYRRQRATVPEVTEAVLTGAPDMVFASVRGTSGDIAGVGRLSLHPGWAGLGALWVDPSQRGQGLGRRLLQTLAAVARERGAASLFLQVEASSHAGMALYESHGLRTHHAYVYLRPAAHPSTG